MLAFCFPFAVSAHSSHSPAPCRIPLAHVGCGPAVSRGGPLRRGLPLSARPRLPPGPLRDAASRCPERGVPSEAEAPGKLGRKGGRRRCGLPASRPGDTRSGCRAPLAAAFRAFLSFRDLHKDCYSAGECGAELQRLAARAAITAVLRRPGPACSC